MTNKRKTPSEPEVKVPLISTSVHPVKPTAKRKKKEKSRKGKKEQDAPVGVRDYGYESGPKRAPKIPLDYDGPLTILYRDKRILEVQYNPIVNYNVTTQRAVTLSVVYESSIPLLQYFGFLYNHMLSNYNSILPTWKDPILKNFIDEKDNAEMKLILENIDDASRLWLHYMFLRLYEENTRTLVCNIHKEHEIIYFTYALLLSEETINKPSEATNTDPIVVHLGHTLFRKLGYNDRSPQIALHQWSKHAMTNTLIAIEDCEGVKEAEYYSSLLSALGKLNQKLAEGSATRILAVPSEIQEYNEPEAPSLDCTCNSCNIKVDPSFNELRRIFTVLRQMMSYDMVDLISASHPIILSGIQEYGILGMHFLQLMSRNHNSFNTHFPPSFHKLLSFMSQWVKCQSISLGGIPGTPKIDRDDDDDLNYGTDSTVEPEEQEETAKSPPHFDMTADSDEAPIVSPSKSSKETIIPVPPPQTSLPAFTPPALPSDPPPESVEKPKDSAVSLAAEEASLIQEESAVKTSVPAVQESSITPKESSGVSTEAEVAINITTAASGKEPLLPIPPATPSSSSSSTETKSSEPTFQEISKILPTLTQEQYDSGMKSGHLQSLYTWSLQIRDA